MDYKTDMSASLKLVKTKSASAATLDRAREVLDTEIKGLLELQKSLGKSFEAAIGLLLESKGRVIVTGVGKSGHIGRKIAATLASTGTPAQFVHATEASHGDLGMVTEDDLVLAISNSGEVRELHDVLAYCKRFSIPLIAITKNPNSALGEAADVVLQLPDAQEACPMGLAPTTSTTLALALGDALAVCLLEQKEFSADKFRDLHPGGKLGQQLIKVEKLMHRGAELPIARANDLMRDVLIEMSAKRFGCVAIVGADGKLNGAITDGDLRRHMNPDFLNQPASEIMTVNPTVISSNALAAEALGVMNKKSITCLFVVDDGMLVGIIHIHDCLRSGVM